MSWNNQRHAIAAQQVVSGNTAPSTSEGLKYAPGSEPISIQDALPLDLPKSKIADPPLIAGGHVGVTRDVVVNFL